MPSINTSASGHINVTGIANASVAFVPAAFDDFGWAAPGQPDPAKTYVLASNTGLGTGAGAADWTRHWVSAVAPGDYSTSAGNLWNRAAYAAVGIIFPGVTAGTQQMITGVQFEISPIESSADFGPTDYSPAREIETVVYPDRLNYSTNPSFEVDASGWSIIGTKVAT
jgi:hypothetical protein